MGAAALDEAFALLLHLLGVLFSHRAAEQVGLAERVACEHAGSHLDLFLIDNDTVRFRADFFEKWMQVFDLFDPLFALDVVVDELHRAWTIKRTDGDDVLDTADIESLAAIRNATAFHLENAKRFASVVNIKGGFVVAGYEVDVEIWHLRVDESHRLLHDRERAQAEEVHFEHAEVGERAHGILGDDFVFLAPAERDEFIERTVAYDDTRRMDARVAAQAFEHGGVVPKLANGGLVLDGALQLGVLFAGLLEVDIQLVWDHLRHAVAIRVAPA